MKKIPNWCLQFSVFLPHDFMLSYVPSVNTSQNIIDTVPESPKKLIKYEEYLFPSSGEYARVFSAQKQA